MKWEGEKGGEGQVAPHTIFGPCISRLLQKAVFPTSKGRTEQKDKSAVYVPLIRDLRSTHLHSLIQIFVH